MVLIMQATAGSVTCTAASGRLAQVSSGPCGPAQCRSLQKSQFQIATTEIRLKPRRESVPPVAHVALLLLRF